MINWLKKIFTSEETVKTDDKLVLEKPSIEVKDPMDFTKTKLSTDWWYNTYCPQCKNETEHIELMTDICRSCGYFDRFLIHKKRVSRKIWNGSKWVIQHKYGNEKEQYEIVDK